MTPPPRSSIAGRILVSFAITLVAFAITAVTSVVALRRAAQDSVELEKGFVPVALKLAQLRATQATISTLVDGIPDERNPVSTRLLLETLAFARRTKFSETRMALRVGLVDTGSADSRATGALLADQLDAIEASLAQDRANFEEVFAALARSDSNEVNRLLIPLGALEHAAEKRLHELSDRVGGSMDGLSEAARKREVRSGIALLVLSALTLAVGILVALRARRLLRPLADVRERAQAVARGDLTAKPVKPTGDEIGELAVAFETMVDALGQAQSQSLQNERLAAIGKMAAHVTHEIRNPLSSIGLNLELLEDEVAGAGLGEARTLVRAIVREVGRLELLSEDYLRLARLPSPRIDEGDLGALVAELTSFARPEMEQSRCTLQVSIEDKLPPTAFDEGQIRQALLNLLRNAREAMSDGGGEIKVTVAAEGMGVVTSILDRGGGIPEEIRERVFDPFFSTKGEGTGLGLAITRQIVVAHGGNLTCEARAGGGTIFRVVLPIAPARLSMDTGPLPSKK